MTRPQSVVSNPMTRVLLIAGFIIGLTVMYFGVVTAGEPPLVPNALMTPGDTLTVSLKALCTPGYSSGVRNVTESEKRAVFKEYGIDPKSGHYEIDHLISLELGGSNSVTNLWPQSYESQPFNAHVKDKLEDRLHSEVCHGQITLQHAQGEISSDWISAAKQRGIQ